MGKNYKNDIFVGDFHTGNLHHFDVRSGRAELLLEKPLLDRIVNSTAELKNTIFGTGFGGITDLEVGPDGYLNLLALQFGGRNCDPNLPNEPCVPYTSGNMGTLFRIVHVNHLRPVASE